LGALLQRLARVVVLGLDAELLGERAERPAQGPDREGAPGHPDAPRPCQAAAGRLGKEVAARTHEVRIEGMKFVPDRLEVAVGDRVTWTNRDFVPHSVTAKERGIESGDLTEGKSWTYVARRG